MVLNVFHCSQENALGFFRLERDFALRLMFGCVLDFGSESRPVEDNLESQVLLGAFSKQGWAKGGLQLHCDILLQ